jgi:hypothetical protein
MSTLSLLFFIFVGLTALAAFVVYSACVLAGRSDRLVLRQPSLALRPQPVVVTRRPATPRRVRA